MLLLVWGRMEHGRGGLGGFIAGHLSSIMWGSESRLAVQHAASIGLVRDEGVAGSNPATPIIKIPKILALLTTTRKRSAPTGTVIGTETRRCDEHEP